MFRILVVEDDVDVGNMLEKMLRPTYAVSRAYSGTEALLALQQSPADLVLLDLMLPGRSGSEILPDILPTPVIVVSARPDPDEKADLLFRGASDYVTKPFHPRELLARIAAHLRTQPARQEEKLAVGPVRLDAACRRATGPDGDVQLTRTETAILKLLMRDPKTVFARPVILERISDDTPDCTESSLKVHMSNLRHKLASVGADGYIESVWGIGFKIHFPKS